MMLHTCRGMRGYSGAPILVSGADDEIEIAGIHVAMSRNNGSPRMFAVPAQAIAFEPARDPVGRACRRCMPCRDGGSDGQRLVRVISA